MDRLLHQTEPNFPYPVRRYGCRVMTLLAIPQLVVGRQLTDDQVLGLIDRGRNTPGVIIDSNMTCGPQEEWLINWGFDALGVRRRGRQVGWEPRHIDTVRWQWMIAHWETAGPDGHFTLHDRYQQLVYDPHDPVQAGYEIARKRIQRRLLYATWEAPWAG